MINWHGFAVAIFEEAMEQGLNLKVAKINPITTVDYPTPSPRPKNSELNCGKIMKEFGIKTTLWENDLALVLGSISHAER